jgi:hypothetical protein
LGAGRVGEYDEGMGRRFQIPLFTPLIVVAIVAATIFAGFFSVPRLNGQSEELADIVFAATAGIIMGLYFLCRRSPLMSIGLFVSLGGLAGFRWSGSAHFKGDQPNISRALFGAFVGATIGIVVGYLVIASRSWKTRGNSSSQAHRHHGV